METAGYGMTDQLRDSRILVAGATGYLGKFVVKELNARGYRVRLLTRSIERLEQPGPFTAPSIPRDSVDDVFVGEFTRPDTLAGLMDGIDARPIEPGDAGHGRSLESL